MLPSHHPRYRPGQGAAAQLTPTLTLTEGALYLQQLQHSTRYERLVDPEAVVWRTWRSAMGGRSSDGSKSGTDVFQSSS